MYSAVKHSHLIFIVISILLFETRYFLKVFNKNIPRLLKIIPHINDTLLLVTGVSLAYMASIKPWEQTWLGYKLIALLAYIIFGMMALKSNGIKSVLGFLMATISIVFMIFTAVSKNALFFLS
jgi:uncharacterized membrane protein SirB2